jgi:hypothetical protein
LLHEQAAAVKDQLQSYTTGTTAQLRHPNITVADACCLLFPWDQDLQQQVLRLMTQPGAAPAAVPPSMSPPSHEQNAAPSAAAIGIKSMDTFAYGTHLVFTADSIDTCKIALHQAASAFLSSQAEIADKYPCCSASQLPPVMLFHALVSLQAVLQACVGLQPKSYSQHLHLQHPIDSLSDRHTIKSLTSQVQDKQAELQRSQSNLESNDHAELIATKQQMLNQLRHDAADETTIRHVQRDLDQLHQEHQRSKDTLAQLQKDLQSLEGRLAAESSHQQIIKAREQDKVAEQLQTLVQQLVTELQQALRSLPQSVATCSTPERLLENLLSDPQLQVQPACIKGLQQTAASLRHLEAQLAKTSKDNLMGDDACADAIQWMLFVASASLESLITACHQWPQFHSFAAQQMPQLQSEVVPRLLAAARDLESLPIHLAFNPQALQQDQAQQVDTMKSLLAVCGSQNSASSLQKLCTALVNYPAMQQTVQHVQQHILHTVYCCTAVLLLLGSNESEAQKLQQEAVRLAGATGHSAAITGLPSSEAELTALLQDLKLYHPTVISSLSDALQPLCFGVVSTPTALLHDASTQLQDLGSTHLPAGFLCKVLATCAIKLARSLLPGAEASSRNAKMLLEHAAKHHLQVTDMVTLNKLMQGVQDLATTDLMEDPSQVLLSKVISTAGVANSQHGSTIDALTTDMAAFQACISGADGSRISRPHLQPFTATMAAAGRALVKEVMLASVKQIQASFTANTTQQQESRLQQLRQQDSTLLWARAQSSDPGQPNLALITLGDIAQMQELLLLLQEHADQPEHMCLGSPQVDQWFGTFMSMQHIINQGLQGAGQLLITFYEFCPQLIQASHLVAKYKKYTSLGEVLLGQPLAVLQRELRQQHAAASNCHASSQQLASQAGDRHLLDTLADLEH